MRKRGKQAGKESAIRAFFDRNRKQNQALQKLLNSLEKEFEASKKSLTNPKSKMDKDTS